MEPDLRQAVLSEIECVLRQAQALHQSGQLQLAEQLYTAILQLNPNHPDANHNMGVLAVHQNQSAAALPYLLTALNADPARAQYWISYIDTLSQSGQLEEARQILTLARQQGLAGNEVDALVLRLEGTEQTTAPSEVTTKHTVSAQSRPVASHKKHPKTQDINALSALLSSGKYVESIVLAQKLTESFPGNGLGWKALGIAYMQLGRNTEALEPMKKAVRLQPNDADTQNNLGNVLQNLGRLAEAEHSYRKALTIKPAYAEVHCNLGNNLQQQGRLNEAEKSFKQAIRFKQNYADAYNNLGNLLQELGRLDEAEVSFRHALKIRPDFAQAHNNLGTVFKAQGRLEESVASARRAVALKPDYADAYNNLGGTLRDIGKPDEAASNFRQALAINPAFAEAASNLGGTLRELGQLDEAIEKCNRALQIKPDFAGAYSNLSGAQKELGQLDEAVASCRSAIEIDPAYVNAYSNLGSALQVQGEFDMAITTYLQALAIKPDFQEARMNLGFSQLSCGQLSEGWKNHEFRTSIDRKRFIRWPQWAGENLNNKTVLIWGEQGIGDEIMFASLFSAIIAQAGRCIIECATKLVPIFTRTFPSAQIVGKANPPHPATQVGIDYQCTAGSLAQWLRPNLASFPLQNSFLTPAPARIVYWKTRLAELGTEPKIGFCWRSSVKTGERNLHYTTLDQWGPIFNVTGVHFINLQYDECSSELNQARDKFNIPLHTFTEIDMYNDLDETAALIASLDLVISAPTAVSSIAAAMGVNTWVMSYGISWETHGLNHNPWFPTLHYFNRRWNQPWDEIIGVVAKQLKSNLSESQSNGYENAATLDDNTCHTRFPHLNPLPEGDEANKSLREFHVNSKQK